MSKNEAAQPQLISLSDFNADLILQKLCIRQDRITEEAVRFVFRMMCDEQRQIKHKINYRYIIEDITNHLEVRLGLLSKFEKSFFGNLPYEREALHLAVICDDLLERVNEPLINDPRRFNREDFPHSLAQDARAIKAEAQEFDMGMTSSYGRLSDEALFLAHFNALDELGEVRSGIKKYSNEELLEWKSLRFPIIQAFLETDVPIGREIETCIKDINTKINGCISTATILPFRKPELRI